MEHTTIDDALPVPTQARAIRPFNDEPVAVLIPYREYQKLQQQEILTDIRDDYEAQRVFQAWLDDPSSARPYEEFHAELVAEELLDA